MTYWNITSEEVYREELNIEDFIVQVKAENLPSASYFDTNHKGQEIWKGNDGTLYVVVD